MSSSARPSAVGSRSAAPQGTAIHIFLDAKGRWCAHTSDGLQGGIFVDRAAAIKFARQEGDGMPFVIHETSARAAERRDNLRTLRVSANDLGAGLRRAPSKSA